MSSTDEPIELESCPSCGSTVLFSTSCRNSWHFATIPKNDPVNHPFYYTFGKIEVADAIDDWDLTRWRMQVVKYVVRAGRKHKETEVEDLKKAKWYLEREIGRLEK